MSNSDMVDSVTAMDIIKFVLDSELTTDLTPYQVFCLGSVLKNSLIRGGKDIIQEELNKALKYKQLGERN